MKTTILFALGVLTGLAFSRIPHYVDQYANHSLPPEYKGEKATMRYFNGGKEVGGMDGIERIAYLGEAAEWLNDPMDKNGFTQPWVGAQ